jgi:threonine/homoserine/homoserine lactone efflux protein
MPFLEYAAVISPLAVYALAVPMPGPSFVIITQASLGGGRLAGMIAAIGTTVGVAAYATATLLGISALSAALPWLITIIQVLGGLYLVDLGIQALRAATRGEGGFTTARHPDERLSIARTFSKALLVSLGNPNMAALFFGLFAPLVGPSHSPDARLLVLGGVVLIDLFYHQVLATILVWLAAVTSCAAFAGVDYQVSYRPTTARIVRNLTHPLSAISQSRR